MWTEQHVRHNSNRENLFSATESRRTKTPRRISQRSGLENSAKNDKVHPQYLAEVGKHPTQKIEDDSYNFMTWCFPVWTFPNTCAQSGIPTGRVLNRTKTYPSAWRARVFVLKTVKQTFPRTICFSPTEQSRRTAAHNSTWCHYLEPEDHAVYCLHPYDDTTINSCWQHLKIQHYTVKSNRFSPIFLPCQKHAFPLCHEEAWGYMNVLINHCHEQFPSQKRCPHTLSQLIVNSCPLLGKK